METDDFPMTVIENEDGSFTLEWDSEHPTTSVMNNWTNDDFLKAIEFALDNYKDN